MSPERFFKVPVKKIKPLVFTQAQRAARSRRRWMPNEPLRNRLQAIYGKAIALGFDKLEGHEAQFGLHGLNYFPDNNFYHLPRQFFQDGLQKRVQNAVAKKEIQQEQLLTFKEFKDGFQPRAKMENGKTSLGIYYAALLGRKSIPKGQQLEKLEEQTSLDKELVMLNGGKTPEDARLKRMQEDISWESRNGVWAEIFHLSAGGTNKSGRTFLRQKLDKFPDQQFQGISKNNLLAVASKQKTFAEISSHYLEKYKGTPTTTQKQLSRKEFLKLAGAGIAGAAAYAILGKKAADYLSKLGNNPSNPAKTTTSTTLKQTTTTLYPTLPSGLKLEYRNTNYVEAIKTEIKTNAKRLGSPLEEKDINHYFGRVGLTNFGEKRDISNYVLENKDYIQKVQGDPNYFVKLDAYFKSLPRIPTERDQQYRSNLRPLANVFAHRNAIEAIAQKYTSEEIDAIGKNLPPEDIEFFREQGFKTLLEKTNLTKYAP